MTVSTRDSINSGGSYRKPGADLYTVLLVLALLALLLGILYLHLEMQAYDYQMKDDSLAYSVFAGENDRLAWRPLSANIFDSRSEAPPA
jgi:hypothetical protein